MKAYPRRKEKRKKKKVQSSLEIDQERQKGVENEKHMKI
jgi:hypothetical protein